MHSLSLYCWLYVPGAQIVKRGVQMVGSELNRTLGKRGEKTRGDWSALLFFVFFLFNFSPALYYLNARKRLNRPLHSLPPPPKKKPQQQQKTTTMTTQNYRKNSRGFEDHTFKQFILPHLKPQRVFLHESDWPSVTHPQFVRFWVFQSRTLRLLQLHCVQHRRCGKKIEVEKKK